MVWQGWGGVSFEDVCVGLSTVDVMMGVFVGG